MTNKNYQTAKFYSLLFELKNTLNNDVLPLAVHIGANAADAKLFESLEIAATDIHEHLEKIQLQIKETK